MSPRADRPISSHDFIRHADFRQVLRIQRVGRFQDRMDAICNFQGTGGMLQHGASLLQGKIPKKKISAARSAITRSAA